MLYCSIFLACIFLENVCQSGHSGSLASMVDKDAGATVGRGSMSRNKEFVVGEEEALQARAALEKCTTCETAKDILV